MLLNDHSFTVCLIASHVRSTGRRIGWAHVWKNSQATKQERDIWVNVVITNELDYVLKRQKYSNRPNTRGVRKGGGLLESSQAYNKGWLFRKGEDDKPYLRGPSLWSSRRSCMIFWSRRKKGRKGRREREVLEVRHSLGWELALFLRSCRRYSFFKGVSVARMVCRQRIQGLKQKTSSSSQQSSYVPQGVRQAE